MSNILNSKHIQYLITLIVILMCQNLYSQTFQENILYGDEAMDENDFYGASIYYRNALLLDSSSLKAEWKYAESCRKFNNYLESERHYLKILERDKNNRYPYCKFWLATVQKSNGKYDAAQDNFRTYYEENKATDDFYTQKAKIEIEACALAKLLIAKELDVTVEHLYESEINTPYAEFNAFQLGDSALIFSSMQPLVQGGKETFIPNSYISKIYIAYPTQTGWTRVNEIDPKINSIEEHNANAIFTKEQSRIYFTRGSAENNPLLKNSIWYSDYIDGKWNKPTVLNNNINTEGYTNTQPALAELKENTVLYFVSDRPGGYGNLDIWYSIYKDEQFHDPVNLGSNINTPGNEITPFYYDTTSTLYFSSDWHPGLGGYDIFKSKGLLNDWTKPENIGYPINTSYNDIYFTVNDVDGDGYLTSNRPGALYLKSETCCNDIFSYEWHEQQETDTIEILEIVETETIESSIKLLLPLTLYFHNDEPNPKSLTTSTEKNYKTTLDEYFAMKDKYKTEYSKGLTGLNKIKAEEDIENFFDNYVGHGFSQLNLFADLLLQDLATGSNVQIMIKGYCSPLHSTDYNINLAKRRISSLKNFLNEYNEGVFLQYLDSTAENGGSLRILEDPIGESTASPFVSDNPNDTRNSIYSRAAAFERKIQIVLYESEQNEEDKTSKLIFPEITFDAQIFDFGDVEQGRKAIWVFKFTNTGEADLVISTVETTCACITVDWTRNIIKPGKEGEISIFISTNDLLGQRNERLTIISNSKVSKTLLNLKLNIIPPVNE